MVGGVGLAVVGWVATALLVGVFVGIGRGVGQRVVGVAATPTRAIVATLQPIVTPTVLFPDSLAVTQTVIATNTATPVPVASVADLDAAVARVAQEGYTVKDTSTYDAGGPLHVVIGTRANGQDNRAFFFWQKDYLGNDAAYPSTEVTVAWQDAGANTIVLRYRLYKPSDPMCCPSGGSVDVRFQWNGTKLVALDYIPEASINAPLSRRGVGAPYVVREYSERRADGSVWLVRQWSDGHYQDVSQVQAPSTPTPIPSPTPMTNWRVVSQGTATMGWFDLVSGTVPQHQNGPNNIVFNRTKGLFGSSQGQTEFVNYGTAIGFTDLTPNQIATSLTTQSGISAGILNQNLVTYTVLGIRTSGGAYAKLQVLDISTAFFGGHLTFRWVTYFP